MEFSEKKKNMLSNQTKKKVLLKAKVVV